MTAHNIEAEQQLLGAMLLDNAIFHRVAGMVKPEWFFEPVHGRIFDAIASKVQDGVLASPVTLKMALDGDDGLKALGGPAYLARMAGTAITSAARDYAEIVADAAALRALDDLMKAAKAQITSGAGSRDVSLALLSGLQALPEVSGRESRHSFMKAATEAVSGALAAYQGHGSYLATGLEPLDRIIRGLGPGNYCLIGGAPSMGKTSLAVEIAANVGMVEGQGVVFVSLEMTKEELANRVIARSSRIPYNDIRAAEGMEEAAFRKWIETAKDVGDRLNMEIVPRHVRTAAGIRSAIKRAAQQLPGGKPSLVIVDYAQLIEQEPGKRYSGRTEFMTEVSVRLKDMASIDGYPLIAIVQLNREIGKRPDRRPQLTDIRETGQFEQDADQVIMCHRESYWLERNGPEPDRNGKVTDESRAEWGGEMQRWKNRMEIYVRKNRHGRIGGCEVGVHEPTNRFWRLGDEHEGFA